MTVRFFIPGHARTAGSKRAAVAYKRGPNGPVPVVGEDGRIKTYVKDSTGQAGENWRTDVRAAAREAMAGRVPFDEPIVVDVTFYSVRPRGHYGSGRNSSVLKPSAAAYPTSRQVGDTDKLVRALLDAMMPLVMTDDSLVVDIYAHKRYADHHPAGAQVQVAARGQLGWSLEWRVMDTEQPLDPALVAPEPDPLWKAVP